jgi:hypothetical protein
MSNPPGALIQLGEVVNDPDFAQQFTVQRSTISWLNGIVQSVVSTILVYGPISEVKARDLKMIPEGDRVHGARVFWSPQILYATHATGGKGGLSDLILWNNHQWRVITVGQYQDYGFYRAIAVRLKPD